MRKFIQKYGKELCGSSEFFLEEALRRHVEERRASNFTNLIKALHALEYLCQLRREGLDPLLKGGTAVQLLLPEGWQRLSIDLDLCMSVRGEEVEEALRSIHSRFGGEYYSYEPRKSDAESAVSFHNYRISVPTYGGRSTILLDILGVDAEYETQNKGLRSFFYESGIQVRMPTIDAILGDKLSTLGPETIGRYLQDSRNGLEYIKHLYDIRQLFPHITDLGRVLTAYEYSHRLQLRLRNIKLRLSDSLSDMINVCRFLTLTNETAEEQTSLLGNDGSSAFDYFRICDKGLNRFQPFLTFKNSFTWENVRETAATIAFAVRLMGLEGKGKIKGGITDLLRSANDGVPRIARDEALIDTMIKEISSRPVDERWHINSVEIKENPLLVAFWYGYLNPERFMEHLSNIGTTG